MRKIAVSTGKILLFLAIWAALLAAVTVTAVNVGGEFWYDKLGWRYFAEVGGAGAILCAFLVMAFFVDKRGPSTLGFPLAAGPSDLVFGTMIGGLIFLVPLGVLLAMGAAKVDVDLSQFDGTALLAGLGFTLFNVVHQELLVRSYMFQELWTKYGAIVATVVTTVIFVAMHTGAIVSGPQGPIAGLNILFASILLSLAYVRSGALWLPIGIHFGWNGLQGPALQINVTGTDIALGDWRFLSFDGPDLWTGGTLGVEAGLAGLAGPIVGIFLVAVLIRKRRRLD